MIPAIEYQLQAVVLTELECEKNYGEEKNIVYYSIGRKDLKKLFKMNLVILQGLYWTAKCIGEKNVNLRKLCHSYVNDSLKMLRDNGISICDHELITDNYNKCHRYLDQIIKHDKEYLMKWQHFCVERGFINYGGGEPLRDFDSPWLKKCAGCYKNISRNREDDVCLIHCNIGDELRSVKPFENLSDIIDKNNILITKKHKELNEDTKTEDVREAEFLLWLNYICVNKENFVWENFDELVNKWNDIDKVTITARQYLNIITI
ncbi:hypothetical protein GLOIN_2v1764289 [Rhizophagus irregularis DAOM 181602=DAOM 197198]|uniref:Uncharacterized protein n=1 Tax=Rhizophagus irregularis (strain DAOM 181602 / DAOM 197198 / MUCL 43194) TaxID=747089 RepID=A0A2P4QSU9_RHIID|nr:hypothetical protein GLOIN_2v1764289 [Rhizophagus irregularis DAOM 181602=DAOM 197198]POG80734.1 hypothetical protein GLOIN_2v1764289 [Rhizophagus irregularis DAOM 181602=DAOM 197198]|eukprot:XP_025187600.1 hypothetical protein GLOIN_2v1764289 [Rhizophagus irregularis DAOM 181602=DAOM 197198]